MAENEMTIFSKDFFSDKNYEDLKNYIKKVNYFENDNMNGNLIAELKNLTNFNPLEMMTLNKFLKEKNMQIISDSEDVRQLYFEQRRHAIAESHRKFMQDYCPNVYQQETFLYLVKMMDSECKQTEFNLKYTNLALMEIVDDKV